MVMKLKCLRVYLSECHHSLKLSHLVRVPVRLCLFGLFRGLLLRHGLRTSSDLADRNDNIVHGFHLFFRHHRIKLVLKFVPIFIRLIGEEIANLVSLLLGFLQPLFDVLEGLYIDLTLQIFQRICIRIHDIDDSHVISSRLQIHDLLLKHHLLAVQLREFLLIHFLFAESRLSSAFIFLFVLLQSYCLKVVH